MDTMAEMQSAIMSAIKINAAALADVQNAEEEKTLFDIISGLHYQFRNGLEPYRMPIAPKKPDVVDKTDIAF